MTKESSWVTRVKIVQLLLFAVLCFGCSCEKKHDNPEVHHQSDLGISEEALANINLAVEYLRSVNKLPEEYFVDAGCDAGSQTWLITFTRKPPVLGGYLHVRITSDGIIDHSNGK